MNIYHGQTSPNAIEKCREAAPSHTHGYEWVSGYMVDHDAPWILDNGAFAAYRDNEPWCADDFAECLGRIPSMPREPEFVILPDVVTDPNATERRAKKWASLINHRTAYPCQNGISPEDAVALADETDSDVLFIGGTVEWKRKRAAEFVTAAHESGLDCHIGRPGDLVWADEIGADSVDTTTIVRSEAYHKLERLEDHNEQQSIFESGGAVRGDT